MIGVLSAIQEQTIKQIRAAGGRAYVVSYPAEVTEILKKETEDQTGKYAGMIEAIECDFNLAADPESGHGLDELQIKIEQEDRRIFSDIKLLQELSYGIRHGSIRIVKSPEVG